MFGSYSKPTNNIYLLIIIHIYLFYIFAGNFDQKSHICLNEYRALGSNIKNSY